MSERDTIVVLQNDTRGIQTVDQQPPGEGKVNSVTAESEQVKL